MYYNGEISVNYELDSAWYAAVIKNMNKKGKTFKRFKMLDG